MARGSGVDVGTSSVKWLAGELKGTTFVVESFVVAPNEDGTAAGGWAALAGEKLGRVRVGVNGRDLNVRYTRVPRLPDWQLRRLMRFETEEIGGQSESRVASDFNVLPEMPEIEGEDVVRFLLFDASFPRSVQSCLDELRALLVSLPTPQDVLCALGSPAFTGAGP